MFYTWCLVQVSISVSGLFNTIAQGLLLVLNTKGEALTSLCGMCNRIHKVTRFYRNEFKINSVIYFTSVCLQCILSIRQDMNLFRVEHILYSTSGFCNKQIGGVLYSEQCNTQMTC